ncbi:MAG: helix-turn-helix domain-containing protein [Clostridiales bacterium]|nr:helix-turn-helix domain-containing protein [Clostridiales bacterium]
MDTIVLSGKRELDIYVNPQRQNLLRCMQIAGVPMTAKQIADQIGISASSVQHHIRLLAELGIVAQSHTEQIHGITATYYRALPKTVRIGSLVHDENRNQRIALMQADLSRTFSGFLAYCEEESESAVSGRQFGDLLSGIVHLGREEAKELYAAIRAFLDAHEAGAADSEAWEYAVIAYPVEREAHE